MLLTLPLQFHYLDHLLDDAVPYALPSQEGPLSQYPTYATIDEGGKWRRIQDWVVRDSNHASVDKAISDDLHDVDQVRHVEEDSRSIGSSLAELEVMRASHASGYRPVPTLLQEGRQLQTAAPRQSIGFLYLPNKSSQEPAPTLPPSHLQPVPQNGYHQQSFEAERRRSDALEIEKLRSRIDILQQALEGERILASQAQQQLQAELLHVKSLADSESASRAAEASLQARLDQTKKTLEMEKRRSAEVSKAASASLQEQAMRITSLETAKLECEAKLKAERDAKNRQARQLELAAKSESELRSQIVDLEAKRDDQSRRLEASCGQIDSLRREIKAMEVRQLSREEKLLKQVEDVEANELTILRRKIEASESALQVETASYAALRECLLSIHHTLSPQQLASAFGYRDELASSTQIASEHHDIADRIAKNKHVSTDDAQFVSSTVRALLHQSQALFLHAERRDVAIRAAADQANEALHAEINLLRTRQKEAEDSFYAQTIELESALREVEGRLRAEEMAKSSLIAKVKGLEELLREAESRHSVSVQEALEFEARVNEEMNGLDESKVKVQEALEAAQAVEREATDRSLFLQDQLKAKDERINELRLALASATESNEQLARDTFEKQIAASSALNQLSAAESQLEEAQKKIDELERTLISQQQYGIEGDRERSNLDREALQSIEISVSAIKDLLRIISVEDQPNAAHDSISELLCDLVCKIEATSNQASRSSECFVPLVSLLSSAVVDIAGKNIDFAESIGRSLSSACKLSLDMAQVLDLALSTPLETMPQSELHVALQHLQSLVESAVSKLAETTSERDSLNVRALAAEKEVSDLKNAVSEEWATLRLEAIRAVQVSEEAADMARKEAEDAIHALNTLQGEADMLRIRLTEIEQGEYC